MPSLALWSSLLSAVGLLRESVLQPETVRPDTATSYYLQQSAETNGNGTTSGSPFNNTDDAIDALSGGDTLYIMGELSNPSYDPDYSFSTVSDSHLWHAENTIKLNNVNGGENNYITIRPYDDNTVLKGDGANIFRVATCSYIKIIGFEIEGEVDNIPLSTAQAVQFVYKEDKNGDVQYRVPVGTTDAQIEDMNFTILGTVDRPSYTDTRGIYVSKSSYIVIEDNHVHHMPGGGIRVSNSEHVDIIGNEVNDNSRRSFSGTHGLVVTGTKDRKAAISGNGAYRARIIGNEIHHNFNEIYSWAPTKSFITPHIDEGKGISLQRNQDFTANGRILVANNVAYWNGFSGIHSNDGDNIDFVHNTAYFNSYTSSVTNKDGEQKGNNIGISMSDGSNCKIVNNIAVIDTDWNGYALSVTEETQTGLVVANNLLWGIGDNTLNRDSDLTGIETGTLVGDPKFVQAGSWDYSGTYDFSVGSDSPAIDAGSDSFSSVVSTDYDGTARDSDEPTIGAYEFTS